MNASAEPEKQSQSNPTCRGVASGEAGSNPTCPELVEPVEGVEPISKACFLPVLLFNILPGDWLHVDFEQLGPADKPSVVRLFLQVQL